MAVSWFRVFDDADNQIALAVPNFTAEWSTVRGIYSVAELIQRYAQFPIEATWFTTTSDMKTALQGAGLPLVYAIQDIIDSGNVKWYFDEGKTHYIQFSKTNIKQNIKSIIFIFFSAAWYYLILRLVVAYSLAFSLYYWGY